MVYELYLSKAATKKKKIQHPPLHVHIDDRCTACRGCNVSSLVIKAAVHLCSSFLFTELHKLVSGFLTFELNRKTGTRKQRVDFPEATQQMNGRSRAWGSIPVYVPALDIIVYMEVKVWLSSIFRSFFTATINSTGKREFLKRMRNYFFEADSKYMVSIED